MELSDIIKVRNNVPRIIQNFVSIEGEGEAIGEQSLYLRLSECNARCTFCDTKFSWKYDTNYPEFTNDKLIYEINKNINNKPVRRVTLTGGEPILYVNQWYNIFNEINKNTKTDLTHFGIESNGIMISSYENSMNIVDEANKFTSNGVVINLTISPKTDYQTSWNHVKDLDQKKLDNLYFKVYENSREFTNIKMNYKFVYDYTSRVINWESTKLHIDKLLELGVHHQNIMLMPLTPDDPLGKGKLFWEFSKQATALKCMELGIRISPRLHVDLDLD